MPMFDAALLPWVALAAAGGSLAGVRPFGAMFALAVLASTDRLYSGAPVWGLMGLPGLAVLGALALAERVADGRALAGQDDDLLLTAVRVPAGAVLATLVLWGAGVAPGLAAWALPLGALLAAVLQAARASVRALLCAVDSPRGAFVVATVVDLGAPAALWLAWVHPHAFLWALGLLVLLSLPCLLWWVRELRSRVRHARVAMARAERR